MAQNNNPAPHPNTNDMLKYQRVVPSTCIDVYDVLEAFNVTCPARQHAIKKLLCAGQRGAKSVLSDLVEAEESVKRAVTMQRWRDTCGVK